MEKISYDDGIMTYNYRGYTFECTQEFIDDALNCQGFDIEKHVSAIIDRWDNTGAGQRLRIQISRDVAADFSWISNTIKIIKV